MRHIAASAAEPHPDRGFCLIWYFGQENLSPRNGIVTGGQIQMRWRHFEPTEGDFAFDRLDEQLEAVHHKGNLHSDFVFESVPYLKGIALKGQSDHAIGYGPPMYWHPTYREKYAKMIASLASHLKASPYKDAVLGVRQNFCAVGTENYYIPPEYRDRGQWTLEEGVTWCETRPWTKETAQAYKTWAIDLFVREFEPPSGIPVFLRASAISDGVATPEHLTTL